MTTLLSILLLFISAAQARKTLYRPIVINVDGICTSMVEIQGYKCEEHTVTTKDGYILSLQRIPMGRSGRTADKPPVLLQHGIIVDAITWVFISPEESLGFILADNGFDVWLPNSRGTKFSSAHTSLNPNDEAYWEWSWDELVSYDLHASVEYVYNQTGQKLHYVGHSLGTLLALAAFSKAKLLDMIRSAALLSPIAHLNQIPSPATKVAANIFLADSLYWLGLHKFIPKGEDAGKLLKALCDNPDVDCRQSMSLFTGENCCVNSSRIDAFLEHEPQPTATKTLIHLSQMTRTGKIAKYDYGDEVKNMQHYGQQSPPEYDMSSIPKDLPLFLSYGGKDKLSDVKDVQLLLLNLKDHDKDKLVVLYRKDYAHADFVMAHNAKQLVYDPLMDFLIDN